MLKSLIVLAVSVLVGRQGVCAQNPGVIQQQQRKAAEAAKKAATAATAADKAAKDNAEASKKSAVEATEAVHAAQVAVDDATKALKQLADRLIDGQAADSAFGKARDTFRAAEKKYQDARRSVLDSDDFKDRLVKAKEGDDSHTALAELHKEFDAMPTIAEPRMAMQEAKDAYEPLKTKLLEGNSEWVDARTDLKAKKDTLTDSKQKLSKATTAAAKAKVEARKAAAAATAAAATAAAAQQAAQQPNPRNPRRPY